MIHTCACGCAKSIKGDTTAPGNREPEPKRVSWRTSFRASAAILLSGMPLMVSTALPAPPVRGYPVRRTPRAVLVTECRRCRSRRSHGSPFFSSAFIRRSGLFRNTRWDRLRATIPRRYTVMVTPVVTYTPRRSTVSAATRLTARR